MPLSTRLVHHLEAPTPGASPLLRGDAEHFLERLRGASTPLCFFPEGAPDHAGPLRLLAPIDFLEGTESSLALVAALATALPATVILITVTSPPHAPGEEVALVAEARRALEVHARNAGLDVDALTLTVDTGHRDISISELLLAAARRLDADLIVVASHGKSALARLFVGSTTERLVRHTDRALLVVPRTPRA
jgi:nucleotide-binding universal stress UspA family protein